MRNGTATANPSGPARVICLSRVSSDGQALDGTSLDAQRETFASYCLTSALPAPDVRVEVESGGPADREAVERILSEAQAGDLVLVTKVDRWSRNLPYGVASVRALVARGVGWRSITEGIDATTSQGDSTLGILSWVADFERTRIRERTVGARHRLRALGYHVEGHPPLGLRTEGGSGKWRLVPDSSTVAVARLHFELCVAGRSTRETAAELQARYPGVPGLDHASVAKRLVDRRYIGESNTRGRSGGKPVGDWIKSHEAIIDPATWHLAQQALHSRRKQGRPTTGEARAAGHMLRGILRCGHCGYVMAAHVPHEHVGLRHGGYYLCRYRTETKRLGKRCDGPLVRQGEADAHVERLVLERLGELAALLAQPARKRPPPNDAGAEVARLYRRRDSLVRAIADETITAADAANTMREIRATIEAAEARQASEVKPPPVDRGALLGRVEHLRQAWAQLAPAERGEALRLLADRITARSTATRKYQRNAWEIDVQWHEW